MNALFYLLQVTLYSAALWTIYSLVWRGHAAHRASRIYLLLAALLPLALPLIRIRLNAADVPWIQRYALPEVSVGSEGVSVFVRESGAGYGIWIYAAIAVIILAGYVAGYIRIIRQTRRGSARKSDSYTIYTGTGIGPATIGTRIFFPDAEVNPAILSHEIAHIRAGHRYDLLLMQALTACLWINPFSWVILRELKLVHEFEADAQAVRSGSPATYTHLLLSEVFGVHRQVLVHSFFGRPLKRRLEMLELPAGKANVRCLLPKAALLTGLTCACILLVQCRKAGMQPSSASAVDGAAAAQKGPGPDGAVERQIFTLVDEMPAFRGDLVSYLAGNLRYPKEARRSGAEGRAVTQFVITKEGIVEEPKIVRSSGTPSLDAEALRVIASMPRWKPGTQAGQPVHVQYTLPVRFKLGS